MNGGGGILFAAQEMPQSCVCVQATILCHELLFEDLVSWPYDVKLRTLFCAV